MIQQIEPMHQNVQKLSKAQNIELNSLMNLMDQKHDEMKRNRLAIEKTIRQIKNQENLMAKEVVSRAYEISVEAHKIKLLEFSICEKEAKMKFNEIYVEFYKLENLEDKLNSDGFLEKLAKSAEEISKIVSEEINHHKEKLNQAMMKEKKRSEEVEALWLVNPEAVEMCSICQKKDEKINMISEERAESTENDKSCGHLFCKFCIEEWKEQKLECPMCRAVLKG
jgi:hypothetical protein